MAKQPVTYSPELAQRILDWLSNGKSLRSICSADDMPTEAAVRYWAKHDVAGFRERYNDALDTGHDAIADELRHLPDNAKPEDAPLIHVKARILIHLLSKWNPRKYGERMTPPPMNLPPIEIRLVPSSPKLPPPIEASYRDVSDDDDT